MGRSDLFLEDFYGNNVRLKGDVALLGFIQQGKFGLRGDLYDYQLNNWDINSDWKLTKKYDTIVSLRCPYFAKDPETFIEKCFENLKKDGVLFLDWAYGHHWTGQGYTYKVGWKNADQHESAYFEGNFLWSGLWSDSFLENSEFQKFVKTTKLFPAYRDCDIKETIFNETPHVLKLEKITTKYDIVCRVETLWDIDMIASLTDTPASLVNYTAEPPVIGPCKWRYNAAGTVSKCLEPYKGEAVLIYTLPQCYILLMMRKKK